MRERHHKEESCKRNLLCKEKTKGGGGQMDRLTVSPQKVTAYYFWRLRDPKLNAYNDRLTSIYT